jgi:branched-chain amino acid transport system ATP-binding protein
MGLVLNWCDEIYVIEFGSLIAHGPPSAIRTDDRVIAAYLGSAAEASEARDAVDAALVAER